MTEIYIVRHAQAEGNLYRMLQGHWDGDITALGLKQIDALAMAFRNKRIDAVYASDLYRAKKTATAISRGRGLNIQCDPRLREINLGPWETEFFANTMYRFPKKMESFLTRPSEFYLEGAESYQQVQSRALEAVNDIVAHNPGKSVAIVSHGITIRSLVSALSGIPLEDVERLPIFSNTGYARLTCENGEYTVLALNEHGHLTGDCTPAERKATALRHEYVDPTEHAEYYVNCYAEAWESAHGNLDGFDGMAYLAAAKEHYAQDKESVAILYAGDKAVGLLDMDTRRGAHADYGWLSLVYLKEEYRNQGIGIQLLARAYIKYTRLNRKALRLLVAEENEAARAFYKKNGFKLLSTENGTKGKLLLLEKKLGGRAYGDV